MKEQKIFFIILIIFAALNAVASILYFVMYGEIKIINIIAAIMCGVGAYDSFSTYKFIKKYRS